MKRLIKGGLAKLGYHVQGTRYCARHLLDPTCLRVLEFDDVVCRRMFEIGPSLNFIQIGAFDGATGDPLRRYIEKCGWCGILIEPQQKAADELRRLYQDNDSIVVLQAALDGQRRRRELFTIESRGAPAWAGGLASFDRQSILKHCHLIPGLEGMIREETVNCIPFDDVIDKLPFSRLDILQIDTEGADAYVLSLFPFHRLAPAIIHWEVKHLSKSQRESCFDHLAQLGYRFAPSGREDMMAIAP